MSVDIEIFAPHVVAIRVVPRLSVADHSVAVNVPGIPAVHRRRATEHASRFVACATYSRALSHLHAGAPLRRGHVDRSRAHDHLRLKTGHLDAVNAVFGRRPDGRIRRVDLDFGLGILEDRVVGKPLPDLNLNLSPLVLHPLHGCDLCLRIVTETKDVRVVELQLGLGIVSSRDPVAADQGLIQRRCCPVPRVAALRRNLALDQAYARYSRRNVHLRAAKNSQES